MTTVHLGAASWTLAELRLDITVSTVLKTLPNAQCDHETDVWISPRHDFHLSFHISCEKLTTAAGNGDTRRLQEYLKSVLTQAPLWSHLQLSPSLVTPYFSEDGKSFALRLDQEEADVQAPIRIHTIPLASIQVSLNFSYLTPRLHMSRKQVQNVSPVFHNLLGQDQFVRVAKANMKLSDRTTNGPGISSSSALVHQSRNEEDAASNYCEPLSQDFIAFSLLHGTSHIPSEHAAFYPKILSLVDGAFRSLIAHHPTRLPKGLTCIFTDLNPKQRFLLSNFAPSIFMPAYSHEVSQHRPLIPSVAKALATFLRYRYGSKHESYSDPQGETESETEVLDLKETLRGHLWTTMADGLRDPQKARRLPPLILPIEWKETKMMDVRMDENDEMRMEMLDEKFSFDEMEKEPFYHLPRCLSDADEVEDDELLLDDVDLSFLEEEFEELCVSDAGAGLHGANMVKAKHDELHLDVLDLSKSSAGNHVEDDELLLDEFEFPRALDTGEAKGEDLLLDNFHSLGAEEGFEELGIARASADAHEVAVMDAEGMLL